jgi:hypothetical protein
MIFEDDGDICTGIKYGEVSFAKMEQLEAEKSSKSLLDIDERLFTPLQPHLSISGAAEKIEPNKREYYSEGYDANYEGVDDAEIRMWQRNKFHYMRVQGKQILPAVDAPSEVDKYDIRFTGPEPKFSETIINEEHYFDAVGAITMVDNLHYADLVVVGKKCELSERPNGLYPSEMDAHNEGCTIHGVLEEYIEYRAADEDLSSAASHVPHSSLSSQSNGVHVIGSSANGPAESQRDEVVSCLVDAVWPDIVSAMRPLVHQVLASAAERGVPYKIDRSQEKTEVHGSDPEYGEGFVGGGGDFGFASDDDWA